MRFLQKWKARQITIRWSLLRSLVLLILILSAAMGAATFIGRQRAATVVSRDLIQRASDQVETELQRFFEPVNRIAHVVRDWGQREMLEIEDVRRLNALFIPILEQLPQVTSMIVADQDGNEYLLLEMEGRWRNRISRPETWGRRTYWYEWSDAETLLMEYWRELDYDSRLRPWHRNALEQWRRAQASGLSPDVAWTEPYTFFTTKDPGITASIVAPVEDDRYYVIGLDVLLVDISRFTVHLVPSRGGQAFVLSGDDRAVGLPRDRRFESVEGRKSAVLEPIEKLGIAPIGQSVEEWRARRLRTQYPFRFHVAGQSWWGGFRRFSISPQRTFWIGVVVPESDFLGELRKQWIAMALVTLAFLGIVIVMAVFMSRRYSRPLERLAEQSERVRDLDLSPVVPVRTHLREVQQLADAQERMRQALVSFERYVPTEVVRELVRRGEAAHIGGRMAQLTCLFSDIRGFTPLAESMSPEELTAYLTDYFDGMLELLRNGQATIDKLIGDAIFAFWGAPIADPEHSCHAVASVLQCRNMLADFNQRAAADGLPQLPTHFGLAAGRVMVGNVGSKSRLNYTAIGDVVNVASRLERVNALYGTEVLATESVRKSAGDGFVWRRIDTVRVKGRSGSISIYEPMGLRNEVRDETLAFATVYEEALALYQHKRFAEGLETLGRIDGGFRRNLSVARLIGLCRRFANSPPGRGWTPVTKFDFK